MGSCHSPFHRLKATLPQLYVKQVGQPQIIVPYGYFERVFPLLMAAISLPVLLQSHAIFLWRHLAHPNAMDEIDIGWECLERVCSAEWRAGSTLFYWRWPELMRHLVHG
jgi:hypothetical protein